jgi:hypothetical protein
LTDIRLVSASHVKNAGKRCWRKIKPHAKNVDRFADGCHLECVPRVERKKHMNIDPRQVLLSGKSGTEVQIIGTSNAK